MRNSMGSSGFSVDHCFSGPIGTIAPARTNSGSLSIGAAASTMRGPLIELPLQKSCHFALAGKRALNLLQDSLTGLTKTPDQNRTERLMSLNVHWLGNS